MNKNPYPFIIVGADECMRCNILSSRIPQSQMIKIPTKSLGLGDSIAKLTHKLSIPSCGACKVRRSVLNYIFPYVWNASKEVRKARNAVLKLGYEELPVLLDCDYTKVHDINEYVPKFNETYMN